MVRRRMAATVAAMIVAAQLGSPLAAEPTVDQLNDIKAMLSENDVSGLQAYLAVNAELLEGEGQLAILLRRFLLESRHLPNYLSDSPNAGGAPTEEGSDSGADPAGGPPDGSGSY